MRVRFEREIDENEEEGKGVAELRACKGARLHNAQTKYQ